MASLGHNEITMDMIQKYNRLLAEIEDVPDGEQTNEIWVKITTHLHNLHTPVVIVDPS